LGQAHQEQTRNRPGRKPSANLAGEAFWVGFGIITGVLALVAGTRFLTHLLPPDEYGKLALAVSLSTLAVMIFGDPVGKTAVRFYSLWYTAGKPYGFVQNLGRSLFRAAGVIGVCCAGVILSGRFMTASPGSYFVLVTGIFAMLLIFNRTAIALEDAARKRRFRGILQASFEALRFFFAIALVIVLALPAAETVLSGFVMAGILVVTVHGIFLYRLFKKVPVEKNSPGQPVARVDNDVMRAFQSPLIVSSICMWLVLMAERWVLTCFGSPADVGGYAAVYQLAFVPMLLVSSFLMLLIEPVLYQVGGVDKKAASAGQANRMNRYAVVGIMSVTLFLSGILFFTYPLAGTLLLGAEFRSYSWLFPWLILAGGCFAAAQQVLLKLSYDMRTDLLAILWGVVAAAAMAAYAAGAAFWQLKGIVTALVGVNIGLFVFASLFVRAGGARGYRK
jgi:O-antigen/teichoic acid export membrane protein